MPSRLPVGPEWRFGCASSTFRTTLPKDIQVLVVVHLLLSASSMETGPLSPGLCLSGFSPISHPVHFWSKRSLLAPYLFPAGTTGCGSCSACSSGHLPTDSRGVRRGGRLCFLTACPVTRDKVGVRMPKFFLTQGGVCVPSPKLR